MLYRPDTSGPHPGVVVLGGSDGGAPETAASALARHGFAALALAYFGVPALPRHLREIPVEYCADAAAWLARQDAIAGSRVAVLGRSRGAELGLLTAVAAPETVAGVVGYAPSSVAWQAPPREPTRPDPPTSSWWHDGSPVPFVPTYPPGPADVVAGRVRFRPAFERALAEAPADAAIPVERLGGPVLLISGGEDGTWPAREMADRVLGRLAAHAFPHDRTHLHFPEAGHMVGVPGSHRPGAAGPVMARLDTGGCPEADTRASRDAWGPVVDFLSDLVDTRLTNSRR